MLFAVGTVDFKRILEENGGSWVSLTLTYRDDPGPSKFRHDRLKILDRLRYRTGCRRLVWKVEFQRRGVAHLHVLAWVPFEDSAGLRDFRIWLWSAWEGISGGHHRVDARWTTAHDLARYLCAEWTMNRKSYQYRVPATWSHVGRWWGVVGLPATWTTYVLDESAFRKVRRTLRRYRTSNARYRVRCGRGVGLTRMWALG